MRSLKQVAAERDAAVRLSKELEAAMQHVLDQSNAGRYFSWRSDRLYRKSYKTIDNNEVEITVPEQRVDFSGWV